MRIFKLVLALLAVLVALLVAVAFLLPRQVHVERAIVIQARPATVFALVDGFKRFNEWSPWAGLDPTATTTYEGPAFGRGAKMSWKGDPKTVGEGSQEIIETQPHEFVRVRLDFGDQGPASAEYRLAPEGDGTRIQWAFDTDLGMNPIARYFGLMFDGLIGADYERGLASLKELAESLPGEDFTNLSVELQTVEPVLVAYIEATCSTDADQIAATIERSYAEVGRFMTANNLQPSGAPLTINESWSDTGYVFLAALPVDRVPERPIPEDSKVQLKSTYGGNALKVVHRGSYREMPATYEQLFAWAEVRGYEIDGASWDVYVTDPGSTPEAELRTEIYLPVK